MEITTDVFTTKVGEEDVLMIRCHWCGVVEAAKNKKIKRWASLYGRFFFCFTCVKEFVHRHS